MLRTLRSWRPSWAVLVGFFVLPYLQVQAVPPGSQPPGLQPADDQVVATLFGRKIYVDELKRPVSTRPYSEADQLRFASQELARRIIVPLQEQFIKENKLEPTPEELKRAADFFRRSRQLRAEENRARLAKINSQLQSENLGSRDKEALLKEKQIWERSLEIDAKVNTKIDRPGTGQALESARAQLDNLKKQRDAAPADSPDRRKMERGIRALAESIKSIEWARKDMPERMADWMVGPWKFNRALYRKYGGTVIWQQAGTEAVGAMRAWLEEHERAGHFQILDSKLREEFWKYYRHEDHPFQSKKADPFDRPPWEEEPATKPG